MFMLPSMYMDMDGVEGECHHDESVPSQLSSHSTDAF